MKSQPLLEIQIEASLLLGLFNKAYLLTFSFPQMELLLSFKKIFKLNLLFITGLILANTVVKLARYLGGSYPPGYRLFDVDVEQNIPSWYSSTLLLICAGLLLLIALIKIKTNTDYKYHWMFLALIFVGLSVDESISLHEELIEPLRSALNLGGILYFSWILPAILVLGILMAIYFKFLLNLPRLIRRQTVLAAAIYVLGAIGVEMINGVFWEQANTTTPLYDTFSTLEEFMEMLGISIFIYTLLSYLSINLNVRLSFRKERA